MKKLYYNIAICLAVFILPCVVTACSYSEDSLEPSGNALAYKIPQGSNDYDQTIVSYFQKYGTYMLYDFEDKEAYWTPSGWQNGKTGTMFEGKTGFSVVKAEPNYVKQQLALLKEVWFDNYSEKFLKSFLPVKVLLCSEVDSIAYDWSSYPFMVNGFKVGAWYNYYNICVGYGNSTVSQLSVNEKRIFEDKINRVFVQSIVDRAIITPTDEFTNAANYTGVSSVYDNAELWARGTFPSGYSATSARDWGIFMLMMVTHSESFLTTTPSYIDTYDSSEASWEGILSSAKDTNGILKKRYDMVRNYFKQNYDMDLQEIGNHLNN